MPKLARAKIGVILIRELEPRKWRASWVDPVTRKHIRRLLPAATFQDAEKAAREINRTVAQGRGFAPRLRGVVGHTVKDAIIETVKHTGANERTRADYLSRGNAFLDYLEANAKGVNGWGEVTPGVIENYLEWNRRKKVSHDSLRMRLFVLRLTDRYMVRVYEGQYRRVTEGAKLGSKPKPKSEAEALGSILQPAEMRLLLSNIKEVSPMVHCWSGLQGLCGMRMMEAAYLREQDIDFAAATITVAESEAHDPKNSASHRTIPVCAEVLEPLRNWIANLKVRHPEGYLFSPQRNRSGRLKAKSRETRAGAFTQDSIKHLWADTLEVCRGRGLKLPEEFTPRKLRSSFVTAIRGAGADHPTLQRYIGHAAQDILSGHYDVIGKDRLTAIATLAGALAKGIKPFEVKVESNDVQPVAAASMLH